MLHRMAAPSPSLTLCFVIGLIAVLPLEPASAGSRASAPRTQTSVSTLLLDEHKLPFPAPCGGTFEPEVYRQAMLIVAHQELGLNVRDRGAGDDMALAGLTNAVKWNIRFHFLASHHKPGAKVHKPGVNLELVSERTGKLATLWSDQIIYRQSKRDNGDHCTMWSRDAATALMPTFRQLLTRRLHLAEPRRAGQGAVIPEALARHLWTMNFLVQIHVLREIDAAVVAHGFSAQSLALLARGNANLGLLTDQLFTAYRAVYKARAMLYAAMLIKRYPNDPRSIWTQAYVYGMVGLPGPMFRILKKQKAMPHAKVPKWVPALEAYRLFQTAKLQKLAAQHSELSRFDLTLAMMTLANYDVPVLSTQILINLLEQPEPDTFAIFQRYQTDPTDNPGDNITSKANAMLNYSLIYRLSEAAGLPAPLAAKVHGLVTQRFNYSPDQLDQLITDLKTAGDTNSDSHFPSWQSAAAIARSMAIFNIERRLEFLKFQSGEDVDTYRKYLQKVDSLVRRNPWKPLLECFTIQQNGQKDRRKLAKLLASLDVFHPTMTMLTFCPVVDNIRLRKPFRKLIFQDERQYIYAPLFYQGWINQSVFADEIAQKLEFDFGEENMMTVWTDLSPHLAVFRQGRPIGSKGMFKEGAAAWTEPMPRPSLSVILGGFVGRSTS